MALLAGFCLGPYEIESPLGAGCMGEVYRARDTRLDRVVALKVLPEVLVGDPVLREQFEREARAISSLSHPHICALHDVGSQDDIDFLIMEYLDGETLADRIARGPLSLADTLKIAAQIAGALEAAHDKGVVHRDLKPSNVKITSDGHVKLLDFGLAKMTDVAAGANLSKSLTMMATPQGMIMGTAPYMSPEQAMGIEADRPCDVWAFGCVLYEMLTARRPFQGKKTSVIIANVLKAEPDWFLLPSETPDGVWRVLRRSLHKDPQLRLRDIGDARLEIVEARNATPANARVLRSGRQERLAWALALALLAGVFGVRACQRLVHHGDPELESEGQSVVLTRSGATS